jgi:hypothetical protein
MSKKMAGKQEETSPLVEETISQVRAKKRTSPGIKKRRQERRQRFNQIDCTMKEINQLLEETETPPSVTSQPAQPTDDEIVEIVDDQTEEVTLQEIDDLISQLVDDTETPVSPLGESSQLTDEEIEEIVDIHNQAVVLQEIDDLYSELSHGQFVVMRKEDMLAAIQVSPPESTDLESDMRVKLRDFTPVSFLLQRIADIYSVLRGCMWWYCGDLTKTEKPVKCQEQPRPPISPGFQIEENVEAAPLFHYSPPVVNAVAISSVVNVTANLLSVLGKDISTSVMANFSKQTCSKLIDAKVNRFDYFDFRERVRRIPSPEIRHGSKANPHGRSAAVRSVADNMISNIAAGSDYKIWSYSSSRRDAKAGEVGDRSYYGLRDVIMRPEQRDIQADDLVKMTDVDYYVEESVFAELASRGNPIAMYTMRTNHVRSNCYGEMNIAIHDSICYQAGAGSHTYKHQLWDWDRDNVLLYKRGSWLVADQWIYCYVERVLLDENRQIVFLIPAWSTGSCLVSTLEVDGTEMRRFNSRPNGIEFDVTYIDGKARFAIDGWVTERETPMDNLTNVLLQSRNNKSLYASTIATALEIPESDAQGLLASLKGESNGVILPAVTNRPYQAVYNDVTMDYREKNQWFMKPLIDGAFAPVDSLTNDLSCIYGRLCAVAPKDNNYPTAYNDYLEEFIDILMSTSATCTVGKPGVRLHPRSREELVEEVGGSQGKKYDNSFQRPLNTQRIKRTAFQKDEVYPDAKVPRNITNMDTDQVADLMCFVKSLVEFLKEHVPWYAFGLSPSQLGAMIVRVCEPTLDNDGIKLELDFSKFDGSQAAFARYIERRILMRFFPDYVTRIKKLLDAEMWGNFKTRNGVKYNHWYSKLSGGALTSCGNTLINAVLWYISLREAGLSPRDAFRRMGLFGGDDGFGRHPDPKRLEIVTNVLHMKIKLIIKSETDPIAFLGRVWPNPSSDPGSFADPLRVLSKLHCSGDPLAKSKPEIVMLRKAVSLYVTDSKSFLGKIALRMMRQGAQTAKFDFTHDCTYVGKVLNAFEDMETINVDDIVRKFKDQPVFLAPGDDNACWRHFINQINDKGVDEKSADAWLVKVLQSDLRLSSKADLELFRVIPATPSVATQVDGQLIGPAVGPAQRQEPRKVPICRAFVKMECRDRDCKFNHTPGYCRDAAKNQCVRAKCKFLHPGEEGFSL